MDIQQLIYSLEVGSLRLWLVRLAVAIIIGGLGGYYFFYVGAGFNNAYAMDASQLGRQFAEGKGFVTRILRPYTVKQMQIKSEAEGFQLNYHNFPDTVNAPLYPVLLGTLFKATNTEFKVTRDAVRDMKVYPPEMLVSGLNLVLTVLAAGVFYIWMVRAFDDRVGILATAMLVLSHALWVNVSANTAAALLIFLMCIMGLLVNESLLAEHKEKFLLSTAWLAVGTFFAGLLALTSYPMMVLLVPLVGLAALAYTRRFFAVAMVMLVFGFVVGPWLLRNFQLTGHPFAHAWIAGFVDNGYLSGDALWRSFSLEESLIAIGPVQLIRSVLVGVDGILGSMPALVGSVVVVVLFFASLLHVFRRPYVQNSRWFWVAVFGCLLVVNGSFFRPESTDKYVEMNLMISLTPVLVGFGAAFLVVLLDRLPLPSPILQYPIIFLVFAVHVIPLGLQVGRGKTDTFAYPPYFPPVFFLTQSWINEDEVICADIPWATAWYYDRTSLWLPYTKKGYNEFTDFNYLITNMLLTPYSQRGSYYKDIEVGEYKEWASLITRTSVKDAPLPVQTQLPPRGEYLFMTNSKRW